MTWECPSPSNFVSNTHFTTYSMTVYQEIIAQVKACEKQDFI